MAFLPETGTYESGIYQLEITDPVVGGANGIDNLQAKQLANRTSYLKAAIDFITGSNFYAAMATKLKTPRNINGVAFDGTADIEVIGTATNNATANTSFYDTDIFGFFDAASTSWRKITGANLKAALKMYFDGLYANISTIGSLGQQSGTLLASFTLTQANSGKMQICSPGITVTLPPINTIVSGSCFILKNAGTSPYTPVTIALNGNSIESASLKVVSGETLIIQSDGGLFYRVVSRTGRTPMYDDNNISITYNTVYQAASDLTLIVNLNGSYMNGAQIVVGNTNVPTRVLAQLGDDINANTKSGTMSAVIPAGMYYAVLPAGVAAWESIAITAYPHK